MHCVVSPNEIFEPKLVEPCDKIFVNDAVFGLHFPAENRQQNVVRKNFTAASFLDHDSYFF